MAGYLANDLTAKHIQLAAVDQSPSEHAAQMQRDANAAETRVETFIAIHNLPKVQGSSTNALALSRVQEQLAMAREKLARNQAAMDTMKQGGSAHTLGGWFYSGQVLNTELLGAAGLARLFGFQDEAVALVEVDAAEALGAVGGSAFDRAFEDVVVFGGRGRGGGWAGDTEHVAEFGEEQGVVGALLTTLLTLPAGDKGIGRGERGGHVWWRIITRG